MKPGDYILSVPEEAEARQKMWDRSLSTVQSALRKKPQSSHHVLLLDIEGTTTPLPFVTKVLYPASVENLHHFLGRTFPYHRTVVEALEEAVRTHPDLGSLVPVSHSSSFDQWKHLTDYLRDALESHLRVLIEQNSKATYLKAVQGLLWESLYRDGVITGHLFSDVHSAIKQWAMQPDQAVALYSSGSQLAQRLLFSHSTAGDLTPHIHAYFDPSAVGSKLESGSFAAIRSHLTRSLGTDELFITFITDNPKEIFAAVAGGIDQSFMCLRPLNNNLELIDRQGLAELRIPVIYSFAQLIDGTAESLLEMVEEVASYTEGVDSQAKMPF
jgi:enolase-phosphatase E1